MSILRTSTLSGQRSKFAYRAQQLPREIALPKAPVLGWRSLRRHDAPVLPNVSQLQHQAYTTSGRAALLAALRQLTLPAGSGVLVPTYHCPTMVAPVLQAGLVPVYFPVGTDGLPELDGISAKHASSAKAMFVAHYFGLPKSLALVQAWCRARGITLVEDCAHSYFGLAGDRPVGHWGDYATASLSKFFPVSEGGLLASAHHALAPLGLTPPGLRAQVKAAMDVIEFAHRHGGLPGLSHLLAPVFWLKNCARAETPTFDLELPEAPPDAASLMAGCDMDRVALAPSAATLALHRLLPVGGVVNQRRLNFQTLASALVGAPGVEPLAAHLPDHAAPYVWPLRVHCPERADAIYARMRAAQLPVFRWDRIWPGTPADPQDSGPQWSRQVLQMLCHQDLSAADLAYVASTTRQILQAV